MGWWEGSWIREGGREEREEGGEGGGRREREGRNSWKCSWLSILLRHIVWTTVIYTPKKKTARVSWVDFYLTLLPRN